MTEINTLDGKNFAQMFISGANNLYNYKQTVDDLNVFPVPDGDTGTNMSLTVSAVAKELSEKENDSVTATADLMSFATLRGARGNSGVILSQIFRGISKSLKGKENINGADFAKALVAGADSAYRAVMKPTEGTILTVAREAGNGADSASKQSEDITEILNGAVEKGQKALEKTTQMLPALKEANVVDAGGQGWMFILRGMLHYLENGEVIEKEGADEPQAAVSNDNAQAKIKADIKFQYCTEFLINKSKKDADVEAFRDAITPKGDSMLVIDDDDIVKVHIHSNHPGEVLEEALKVGELINLKIENMKQQHSSIINSKKTVKVSKAEKPTKKEELKEYGFVAVSAGKGMAEILYSMGVTRVIEGGQTMNPSADDILKAINKSKAKTVFVFPNNKNIIMAAEQAKQLSDVKVIVIPTKNVPECISAMMVFSEKKEAVRNEEAMLAAANKVSVGNITFAVRDTVIKGKTIKKGDILGLSGSEIKYVGKDAEAVCVQVTSSMVDEDSEFITVYYGKGIKKEAVEKLENQLEEKFPDCDIELKKGGQPLYYYIVSVE